MAADLPPLNDGAPHGDPPFLLESGWTPLLNGRNLDGWTVAYPANRSNSWVATRGVFWDGSGDGQTLLPAPGLGDRIVNAPGGKPTNVQIATTRKFGDVELYIEFLVPRRSNSGVFLHGLYEISILDSYGVPNEKLTSGHCGGIYQRWIIDGSNEHAPSPGGYADSANGKGVGGTPPRVNAARPAGEWQSFQVWFQAPRFDASGKKTANAKFIRVLHNGVLIHENVEAEGPTRTHMEIPEAPTSPLMLQGDHGPVAFRNIYIRPLRPLAKR